MGRSLLVFLLLLLSAVPVRADSAVERLDGLPPDAFDEIDRVARDLAGSDRDAAREWVKGKLEADDPVAAATALRVALRVATPEDHDFYRSLAEHGPEKLRSGALAALAVVAAPADGDFFVRALRAAKPGDRVGALAGLLAAPTRDGVFLDLGGLVNDARATGRWRVRPADHDLLRAAYFRALEWRVDPAAERLATEEGKAEVRAFVESHTAEALIQLAMPQCGNWQMRVWRKRPPTFQEAATREAFRIAGREWLSPVKDALERIALGSREREDLDRALLAPHLLAAFPDADGLEDLVLAYARVQPVDPYVAADFLPPLARSGHAGRDEILDALVAARSPAVLLYPHPDRSTALRAAAVAARAKGDPERAAFLDGLATLCLVSGTRDTPGPRLEPYGEADLPRLRTALRDPVRGVRYVAARALLGLPPEVRERVRPEVGAARNEVRDGELHLAAVLDLLLGRE